MPHAENVSYFGLADEAHVVYQFSLAPLLVLCVVLGVAPFYVLDWMAVSIDDLMNLLKPGA